MQSQSLIKTNTSEMAEAFGQIGKGFLRLAKAIQAQEPITQSRELEYVPIEEVEQPSAKEDTSKVRKLKAVPKAAPVIEAEAELVIERGEPLPLREEWVEQVEAIETELATLTTAQMEQRGIAIEEDDVLPDFDLPAEESAAQIEAQRLELIETLRQNVGRYLTRTKNYDDEQTAASWKAYCDKHDVHNQTRGWLQTQIEKAQMALQALPPEVVPQAKAQSMPGQLPDGRKKMQRADEYKKPVAVLEYEGSHMTGRQATHEETIKNLDYWIDYWRTEPRMGQDLATIRAKVARVVGEFHDWSDLKDLRLSKAIRALQQWRPDLDKQTAQKGAKK